MRFAAVSNGSPGPFARLAVNAVERNESAIFSLHTTLGGYVGLVVTGISQDGNIVALETALKDAGIPLDAIQLIGPDDSTQGVSRGIIGPRIMTGDRSGGFVPGINSSGGGLEFFRNENLSDRLGDLEIPDAEVENYVEALEAGRSVVAFFAKPDTLETVEAIFRASGLAKVKTF